MSKRNAQVNALISKIVHIEGRANMIFERLRGLFVKNIVGFVKVNLLPRSMTKFMENFQKFLETFISALIKENDVVGKSNMGDINGLVFDF